MINTKKVYKENKNNKSSIFKNYQNKNNFKSEKVLIKIWKNIDNINKSTFKMKILANKNKNKLRVFYLVIKTTNLFMKNCNKISKCFWIDKKNYKEKDFNKYMNIEELFHCNNLDNIEK